MVQVFRFWKFGFIRTEHYMPGGMSKIEKIRQNEGDGVDFSIAMVLKENGVTHTIDSDDDMTVEDCYSGGP